MIVNVPFPGHREQKQFAVDHARHDWVLSLDADELVTSGLRDRILQLQADGFPAPAYAVMRNNYYLGRFIRHVRSSSSPAWMLLPSTSKEAGRRSCTCWFARPPR